MARLGDVFECQITGEWGDECADNGMGTKVLRTNNFTPEGRISYDDVVIRCVSEVKAEKKRLHCGDIILEKSGGTEKTPVGRVVFCDESIEDDTYLCNNFTQAMRVNREKAFPRYVFYFMWSLHNSGKTDLLQNKTTGIRNLQVKLYLNTLISFPPIGEQRRIAAMLDKVSDLIAKRRQQLEKLDELVKARFVEMFGDPEKNPKGWRVLPMSGICSVGSSKRIYQSEQTSVGIPFWRISDLTDVIFTGTVSPKLYIPEDRYEELKEQGQVPAPGDILLTSRGTLGQCYIVKKGDKFYFQDGMISWLSKYTNDVTPLYILWLFAMPGFRKQIDTMQTGSTVAYLSIAMIKQLKIMLPPLELQNRFVSFVQHVEKTKTGIIHGLERLETLKRALMQCYFG